MPNRQSGRLERQLPELAGEGDEVADGWAAQRAQGTADGLVDGGADVSDGPAEGLEATAQGLALGRR
ncbi:hypothetical protein [Streptomyces phaeochromogenes]